MKFVYPLLAGLMLAAIPATSFAAPLTRQSAQELASLGLGDDAIIAKIEADKVDFDLSTDEMIELKKKGVSSAVIAALISNRYVAKIAPSMDSPDPSAPHVAGFYAMESGSAPRMRKMEPTVTNQAKTGGIFGYALTGGIASMSVKAAIQKETSGTPVSTRPVFYFFATESNGHDDTAWASGMNTVVASPAELSLIRLMKKDDRREARVGSVNLGGAKTGVMDKDRIEFTHTLVRPGVYRIEVPTALPAGEYGFIYALSGGGTGGAMTARIFDFTVR